MVAFLCPVGGSVSELVRHTETFIVRLWVEYLEQTPPTWRGEIEHVGEESVIRFGSLHEMNHFIQRCASAQPRAKTGEEKPEAKESLD
jgi:hypothetical protein